MALLIATLLLATNTQAQSNSKGKDSPIVIGEITAVADDGKTITILHQGEHSRTISVPDSKVQFVSISEDSRTVKVGYFAKASVKKDNTSKLLITLPIAAYEPLGENRVNWSIEQILAKADANGDEQIDYQEMSHRIYHSPKHGADKFLKADKNNDGGLNLKEFTKLMAEVNWWKNAQTTPTESFQLADTDKSGTLTKQEFLSICRGRNHVDKHFKRTDKDKNGSLDLKEVSAYFGKSAK